MLHFFFFYRITVALLFLLILGCGHVLCEIQQVVNQIMCVDSVLLPVCRRRRVWCREGDTVVRQTAGSERCILLM